MLLLQKLLITMTKKGKKKEEAVQQSLSDVLDDPLGPLLPYLVSLVRFQIQRDSKMFMFRKREREIDMPRMNFEFNTTSLERHGQESVIEEEIRVFVHVSRRRLRDHRSQYSSRDIHVFVPQERW